MTMGVTLAAPTGQTPISQKELLCTTTCLLPCLQTQKPRKSEVRKGVGRQRGLAHGNPSHTINSGLFSAPFFLCPPYELENTMLGDIFCCTLGAVGRQLPPANPFSKPLRKKERRTPPPKGSNSGNRSVPHLNFFQIGGKEKTRAV